MPGAGSSAGVELFHGLHGWVQGCVRVGQTSRCFSCSKTYPFQLLNAHGNSCNVSSTVFSHDVAMNHNMLMYLTSTRSVRSSLPRTSSAVRPSTVTCHRTTMTMTGRTYNASVVRHGVRRFSLAPASEKQRRASLQTMPYWSLPSRGPHVTD